MRTVNTIAAVRRFVELQRDTGKVISLVPTMGYLHQGHLSLVSIARRRSDYVVVSIYVNPTQFGPQEDLAQYPRDLDRDLKLLRQTGTDLVFHPPDHEMYPPDYQTTVRVTMFSQVLCGRSRPHHFEGVTTIVMKLLNIVEPDIAVFGEKDFQQVIIIKRMVKDLHCRVKILTGKTIREKDGLAMSSRNTFLSPEERQSAPILYQMLQWAKKRFAAGMRSSDRALVTMTRGIKEKGGLIDYVVAVDPDTMQPVTTLKKGTLIALAVFFGKTRLIDNITL
jgi:pantoate--beta-alanine ligase